MDKIIMNQFIKKIAYQYQCDINFSDKCLILHSIKYNFYFYIHLDKLTNDVYRRLFSIEKISYVYEKIIAILDIIVNNLNFENDEKENQVAILLSTYNNRLNFTPTNMMYLSTEIFEIYMNLPHIKDIETLDKLNDVLDYIEEVDMLLCQLNTYAKVERICEYGKNI